MDLYYLICNAHYDYVKKIIEKGNLNINDSINYTKETPLHVAIFFNKNKIAKFLIEKGANICVRNYNGLLLIHKNIITT